MHDIGTQIGKVFAELRVQPAGQGYIDCICPQENIGGFISAMSNLGITIDGFTWWCYALPGHPPCGMGGPKNAYGDGYYSEMQKDGIFGLQGNERYRAYLLDEYPRSKSYRKCCVPGFWLRMPRA